VHDQTGLLKHIVLSNLLYSRKSGLAVAAQNVDQLVLNQLLDVCTGRLQVLTRIKLRGVVIEELADGAGHGQTQIGVNVDLADSHGSGLAQLLGRNTDSVRHVAAVLVDHLHVLLRNGRRTVQNDGESRQTLGDVLQNVETQRRRNQNALLVAGALLRLELISTVAGTDSNGQRVATGLGDELLDFLRASVRRILGRNADIILNTGQRAQLSLDDDAVIVGVLNDLLGDLNILSERLGGSIDHDGGKAAVNAGLASLKAVAVIQMQTDGQASLDDSSLDQLGQISVVGISASALGNLQDEGSVDFHSSLSDTLNDLHVVDVESTDGVAAVISFLKHLSSSDQWHIYHSFSKLAIYILPSTFDNYKSLHGYLKAENPNHEKVYKMINRRRIKWTF